MAPLSSYAMTSTDDLTINHYSPTNTSTHNHSKHNLSIRKVTGDYTQMIFGKCKTICIIGHSHFDAKQFFQILIQWMMIEAKGIAVLKKTCLWINRSRCSDPNSIWMVTCHFYQMI